MGLSLTEKWRGVRDVALGRYDQGIDSDLGRWQGQIYANWVDHGFLRRHWRNEGQIAEGVFRANHPDARTLAAWKARGIVDVVSLRVPMGAVHAFEAETCDALGLNLRSVALASREAPLVAELLRLLDIFDTLQRPALIHCKSGADRTGLAAALYHIHVEGVPVERASQALGLRHLHLKWSKTGVLDRVLDAYAARLRDGPIDLRDWIATDYDPTAL